MGKSRRTAKEERSMTQKNQRIINLVTWCSMGALLIFTIYGIKTGIFTDRSRMEALVSGCGIYGPLFFVLIQIVQVVSIQD